MENCVIVNFGVVTPGKVHTKRINISSSFMVTSIESSNMPQPLEEAFSVKRDMNFDPALENRFVVQYFPFHALRKSFAYMLIHFEDGSTQYLYLKGKTSGSDIEFSTTKIHFRTNSKIPTSHFKLTMENFSNCDDYFCWDFIPEDSEVKIEPRNGVIRGHSRFQLAITFIPKKIGLFYRAFPCIFKFHEMSYIFIYGLHSNKELKLDLNKYIHLNKPMPTYPSNYCRYVSDLPSPLTIRKELPVIASVRYIDFGRIVVKGHTVEHITLTNNNELDLVVAWSNIKDSPFRIDPPKLVLQALGGSSRFSVSFRPTKPQLFYRAELIASILWGTRLEYKAPFSITVHLIGDSFSTDACGWGPSYSIERTRIVLPGTIPTIPAYATFQISKTGPLPIKFKMEPIDKTGFFLVKPGEGIIKDDFGLIVIQLLPQDQNDVLFKEEWMLTLNKFAQVKLEICGSCELPFLLAGEDKNVIFPATTVGSHSYLQVPIKNPTRLELEYKCRPCLSNRVVVPKHSRRIGPGETQFADFEFHSQSLGTFTSSLGIWMRWAPFLSTAKKFLKGRVIHSETVLRLTGTAELVRICATPDSLKMNDVFLYDTSHGSFFLSNDGNTTAHMRLRCQLTSVYSHIGEWNFAPNDINLGPGQTIEVKISVIGDRVGYNMFDIQYATYESHLFRRETSEWTNLVHAEVFGFYFSLSVIDVRYNGLAKSLSKLVLWALLRINSLNEALARLETKAVHVSSMKIPDYHTGTPPLKIDLLFKNTSLIPVWLAVEIQKSCGCPIRKNDSISRRIVECSCPHDDQLIAEFDRKQVLAGETVVLSMELRYDETEECHFTMSLFVSRNPIKKCNRPTDKSIINRDPGKSIHLAPDKSIDPVVVQVDAQRGIITGGGIASLNFLLSSNEGPRSFDVSLHDVFIGDDSKYIQVIWMYNHSQKDVRYWSEWLLVNNKVFKILNTRARVAAYSLYPLFIEFTPFEIRTYKAKLAVVNELGDEFHLSIEARGSVCPNLSPIMLTKQMPIDSYFEDEGADVELFPSHIVLSPMTTHSFDKYLFFMKNNSKEIICFSWERLVVWSTVQVTVQPREGELQPGEIFPLQMLVHTFRNSTILNFLVECIYYNKTKFNEYRRKCKILKQTTKTFDSCFTFLPDQEIEIAYHNPVRKLFAGISPMNKIVSMGASLRVFNRDHLDVTFPSLSQQLKFLPPSRIELASKGDLIMTNPQSYKVTEILAVIMRQVVMSKMFQERIKRKCPDIRYIDFLDMRGPPKKKNLPARQMGMLLASLLDSTLLRLFGFEPAIYHDFCIPIVGKVQQETTFKMYNAYYEPIAILYNLAKRNKTRRKPVSSIYSTMREQHGEFHRLFPQLRKDGAALKHFQFTFHDMLRNGIDQMCLPPETVRTKRTMSRDHLAFVQRLSI